MKLLRNAKGEFNNYTIGTVIIVVGLIFCLWYYNDHRNDIVIHPPHVEVH